MPKTTLWIDKEFNQCKIYVFSVFGILKGIWNSKGGFWCQASFLRAATCCQRLQNSKLPPREDPALELVIELGIASAEGGNILKHQNYSDCHHHDLNEAQTH